MHPQTDTRPRRRWNLAWIGLGATAGLMLSAADWQPLPGGRYRELPPATPAKSAGFTLMPPETTGLHFTNVLNEAEGAANRVLWNGSGVALGDYDQDGLPDIFVCGLGSSNRLYRNLGNWQFADVTEAAGLQFPGKYYRGAAWADVNSDGRPDLLVTAVGRGVLCFLNEGNGRFSDHTTQAGTASRLGTMTLALADVDGDGILDLYVTNNRMDDVRDRGQVNLRRVNGRVEIPPGLTNRLTLRDGQLLEYGEPDLFYRGNGAGRFLPALWTDGSFLDEDGKPLTGPPLDWGLSAQFRDLNGDGAPDLYVCNDYWTPDRVWLNDGHGHFRALPRLALRHTSGSSMGVDFADLNHDGLMDGLVVDMLSRDPVLRRRQRLAQHPGPGSVNGLDDRPQVLRNTLLLNRGDAVFSEIAEFAGLSAADWAWQPLFVDVDLDGHEDVLIAAGNFRDVQDIDAEQMIAIRPNSWKGATNATERQAAFRQQLVENNRLYPALNSPVVAFRNRGNLTFEDVTAGWGTEQLAVHHGIATADLDGDGDLDLVVNNLNGPLGVYRNEGTAPRVSVRLRGKPGNVEGIGALVTLEGGAIPRQSREMVAGGRYLSSSEPLLSFACGQNTSGLTLTVRWRSGRVSRLDGIVAQRVYEVDEAGAGAPPTKALATSESAPLFADLSSRVGHQHVATPFDDFAQQPLLGRRLSQLGPGLAWTDLNGDGWDDLVIGADAGQTLGVFTNDTHGSFAADRNPRWLVPAALSVSSVLGLPQTSGAALLQGQLPLTAGGQRTPAVRLLNFPSVELLGSGSPETTATGPLALADYDADGDLDVFVGGRFHPGRYPEPANSWLYRRTSQGWELDTTNSAVLASLGMATGAVWTDLNADGFPELVVACEWGALRVFANRRGTLSDVTDAWKLNAFTGWWNSVAAGDFDGDGRMDLVAGNWGLNSPHRASPQQPLTLHYADFDANGIMELIEAEWGPDGVSRPRQHWLGLVQSLPWLQDHFPSAKTGSEAPLKALLAALPTPTKILEATTLASAVFLNRGDHFERVELPPAAQFAPVFGLAVADANGDGREDVFLAQNAFDLAPEEARIDAGQGLWLLGNGDGTFRPLNTRESGVAILGQQRGAAVADFDHDGRVDLAVTQVGAGTVLLHNQGAKPGLRVSLRGAAGNPQGIGAMVRLAYASGRGPAREVHAGAGYWSQDGAEMVLGYGQTPQSVEVRWPGGASSTQPVSGSPAYLQIVAPAAH